MQQRRVEEIDNLEILHITQNPVSSIDLWNRVTEIMRTPTRWDIATSKEEIRQIDFSPYELVIFEELPMKFRNMVEDADWREILESLRSKTIFVGKSISLRNHGFNVVVESKLLDKVSEAKQNNRRNPTYGNRI
jgi:hypothetical protein